MTEGEVVNIAAEVVAMNATALAHDTLERLEDYQPRTALERAMKAVNLLQVKAFLKASA